MTAPEITTVHFENARNLARTYCSNEANLQMAEQVLGVSLLTRENWIQIDGDDDASSKAKLLFELLGQGQAQGMEIRDGDFKYILNAIAEGREEEAQRLLQEPLVLKLRKHSLIPKTLNQKLYLEGITRHSVSFGIGPAGTGKTYLAMASALHALLEGDVGKIILTRPAVEAGEALGYLPGDLQEKILPYLLPLYDAMEDMLGKTVVQKLIEHGEIEIAPLAYMRGRTLSRSFIVLDEAQNTTTEQMMMFLTRLGEDSRMVVTGDITQVDLPRSRRSGLKEAMKILNHIPEIQMFFFSNHDVVRHPVVQSIIEAYEKNKAVDLES